MLLQSLFQLKDLQYCLKKSTRKEEIKRKEEMGLKKVKKGFRFLLNCQIKPGVDVMITIFCDFRQIMAKNCVFLKNQCYGQFFS
jgi:hypothetical protein